MERVHPKLLELAQQRIGDQEKRAFVPPPGGAPPMDPAAMGGMPPMDPGMMGGMPPMDPGMMGEAPDIAEMVSEIVREELNKQQQQAGSPSAPGAMGKAKVDPAFIYMELSRIRKLLTHLVTSSGLGMPDDILDDGPIVAAITGGQAQNPPSDVGPKTAEDATLQDARNCMAYLMHLLNSRNSNGN